MKRFFVGCLAMTGFMTIVFFGLIGAGVWYTLEQGGGAWDQQPQRVSLPDQFVLSLNLRGLPRDQPDQDLEVAFGLQPRFDMLHLVDAIRHAANDDRVTGLVARIGDQPGSIAQVQEVRDAIKVFRESGKPTFAWSDTFGEWNPANNGYWLASAFEHISMQPGGMLALTGFHLEVTLFAGVLEKIGVRFDGDSRGKYKTIRDTFAEREMTPEHQEMLESLVGSLTTQMVADIAKDRALSEAVVLDLIDRAPLSAADALDSGLVDDIDRYESTLDDLLPASEDEHPERVSIRQYAQHVGSGGDKRIAVLQAVGNIIRGEKPSGQFANTAIYGDSVARLLNSIADEEDDPFDAVLLRIDSGGGSAIASATMGHAIKRLAAKMPVVVSMGSSAASGGYWLAMYGTEIVAQPGTFTGSIGVVVGKPDLSGLSDELDLVWGSASIGENADLWSVSSPYDEAGRRKLTESLDRIYLDFLEGAAEGRGVSVEDIRRVAEGRVWTGAQAQEVGLVDHLGGYHTAIDVIRQKLGLSEDEELELVRVPGPSDPFEAALELVGLVQTIGVTASRLQVLLADPVRSLETLGTNRGALR